MARATLFDPTTGKRTAVDIGSAQERDLFGQGYKLETPTQNYQTYQNPSKEVMQGPGNSLFARDAGGTRQISNPAELSNLVNTGGYQDTRRSLNLAAGGAGGAGTGAGGGAGGPSTPVNPQDSFNQAIAQLLKSSQTGSLDSDLLAQRNALINARFNKVNDMTPEQLQKLTPDQQAALRSGSTQGMQDQLGGINTAIQSRSAARDEARTFAFNMLDYASKQQTLQGQERIDTLKAVGTMNEMYGDSWLDAVTPAEKKRLEGVLGLQDLSQLKGVAAADPNRYQVVGATKYHGNLVFDKSTGRFVGANGEPLSDAELSAMGKAASGGGGGGSEGGSTTSATSSDRAKAVKAYYDVNNTLPAKGMIPYITEMWKEAQDRTAQQLAHMQAQGIAGPIKPAENPFRITEPLNPTRPSGNNIDLESLIQAASEGQG